MAGGPHNTLHHELHVLVGDLEVIPCLFIGENKAGTVRIIATARRVRVTAVDVEMQYELNILSVSL
jgi:hypothetical protein